MLDHEPSLAALIDQPGPDFAGFALWIRRSKRSGQLPFLRLQCALPPRGQPEHEEARESEATRVSEPNMQHALRLSDARRPRNHSSGGSGARTGVSYQ